MSIPPAVLDTLHAMRQELALLNAKMESHALELRLLRDAQQPKEPERWLSVAEAAEMLGVSLDTVYAQLAAKQLVAERVGQGRGTYRIPLSKLPYAWVDAEATLRRYPYSEEELRRQAQAEKKVKGAVQWLLPRSLFT